MMCLKGTHYLDYVLPGVNAYVHWLGYVITPCSSYIEDFLVRLKSWNNTKITVIFASILFFPKSTDLHMFRVWFMNSVCHLPVHSTYIQRNINAGHRATIKGLCSYIFMS